MPNLNYVLITPARNEEAFIGGAIKSVANQTVLPVKWVIVSDGSTDKTDEIVQAAAMEHSWIELVRTPERTERHFAGKVHAFNAGHDRVRNLDFDILVSMDADITFESDYFEFLLKQFVNDAGLGLAGTPFREEDGRQYDFRFTRTDNVSGACHLFRKECYYSIGGYQPLKGGGIDVVAVVSARMKGWKTRTFTEKHCIHHRKMRSARASYNRRLSGIFRSGYHDYTMGVHPLWQFMRFFYQIFKKPFFLSGFLLVAGYGWAVVTRAPIPVSKEFVAFRRKEQMRWLGEIIGQKLLHRN
jgi:glycosyltransferase involved in cell wall biosynthesis